MTTSNVKKHLKALHTELERTKTLQQEDRERLEKLVEEINAVLERTEDRGVYESALKGLEDAVQRFEVTHPDLTAVMSRMINSLSNMGF